MGVLRPRIEHPATSWARIIRVPYPIRTVRVIWPLASQYVFFRAMLQSSGAGWTAPAVSTAREVMRCSPADGRGQSRCQNFQANSCSRPSAMVAGVHAPSSMRTSTRATGAPQAAP